MELCDGLIAGVPCERHPGLQHYIHMVCHYGPVRGIPLDCHYVKKMQLKGVKA